MDEWCFVFVGQSEEKPKQKAASKALYQDDELLAGWGS
jgi:hypothetical protein